MKYVSGTSPLYAAHVYRERHHPGDRRTRGAHSASNCSRLVEQSAPGSLLKIDLVRGYPFHQPPHLYLARAIYQERLGTPASASGHGTSAKGAGHARPLCRFCRDADADRLPDSGACCLAVDPRRRILRLLLVLALCCDDSGTVSDGNARRFGRAGGWRLPLCPVAHRKEDANLGSGGAGCCLSPRRHYGFITLVDRWPLASTIPARNFAP